MFQILVGVAIDPNELVASIIANIPSLIIIATAFLNNSKILKNKVNEFPKNLEIFKTNVSSEFGIFKKELKNVIEMKIQDITEHTIKKIDSFESTMTSFVNNFEGKLNRLIDDNEKLVKENQTYQTVMSLILTGKPEQIKSEIISLVAKELNLSKESLLRLPSEIIASLPQFKDEFIETKKLLGESFEEIMRELGYERKEA